MSMMGFVWAVNPPISTTQRALDHGGRAACSGLLTFLVPIKPKWLPNCADDASVRGAHTRLVQKHHRHNWDLILGRFQLN